ncbi:MAG: thiamine diphosphokinase [Armatimonadetes bacterium]|nr:thiamine diphosphokinase [Armatimonadota bacterium]MBX3108567.1 thiamine diphosphokinase [Fimbriimonadaceae bacterium]
MGLRVLCVLAGGTPPFQSLADLAQGADAVWAADSGQDVCLANGFLPHVVVGDLDSVSERMPGVEYRERPDQDHSDCDKLLAEVRGLGEVDLVMAGLEGDRFDHVVTSLSSIARSGLSPRILLQQGFGVFCRAGAGLAFRASPGQVFSLLSLDGALVSTRGARWEMQDRTVSFSSGFSLSNEFAGDRLEIQVDQGVVMAILDSLPLAWH